VTYSVRNTIILLIALLILGGGGWGFLHFRINPQTEQLRSTLQEKRKQLATVQEAVNGFEPLRRELSAAKHRLENYPKELFPSDDHSLIYGFFNNANQGRAFIRTNIVARATNVFESHGILATEYEATGNFSNLHRFIAAIEHSRPINKITRLEITAVNEIEQLGEVNINLLMESYFSLDTLQKESRHVMEIIGEKVNLRVFPTTDSEVIHQLRQGEQVRFLRENLNWVKVNTGYGPGWISHIYVKPIEFSSLLTVNRPQSPVYARLFYPLVHDIPPNTEGLINVEQSRLIGLTAEKLFLVDQTGTLQELQIGDEVYLGSLSSINQQSQAAEFVLNKGGIIEKYTLQIQQTADNGE